MWNLVEFYHVKIYSQKQLLLEDEPTQPRSFCFVSNNMLHMDTKGAYIIQLTCRHFKLKVWNSLMEFIVWSVGIAALQH